MGKSVKIKISAILACLVLVLITGCGDRGVSEESAEAKRAVPIVTYPVKPMKGEMIKNADDKATDNTADTEDEDNTGDRPVKGQDKETAESDQETGAEAVKAESDVSEYVGTDSGVIGSCEASGSADGNTEGSSTDTAGADEGYADGSETSGAGEGYEDGQDDTAVSEPSESVSDMGGGEYTDNTDEWYEDEGYIEPMPEPAVSEPEAEEPEPVGDGAVLGESVDDGWVYYTTARITFYDAGACCCGEYASGYTASGEPATVGWTCANGALPFGTMVLIDGQEYCVTDRGVGADEFDILVGSHEEALARGMYYTDVYIRW